MNVLIGNFFGLINGLFYCFSTQSKSGKNIAFVQGVGGYFGLLCSLFLEGYQGVITSIFTLCRNWGKYFGILNNKNVYILIVFQITLGLYFNHEGILGLLPVTSSVIYTLMMISSASKEKMCEAIVINSFLWIAYNISILAITSAIFNIVAIIIAFGNIKKEREKPKIYRQWFNGIYEYKFMFVFHFPLLVPFVYVILNFFLFYSNY